MFNYLICMRLSFDYIKNKICRYKIINAFAYRIYYIGIMENGKLCLHINIFIQDYVIRIPTQYPYLSTLFNVHISRHI